MLIKYLFGFILTTLLLSCSLLKVNLEPIAVSVTELAACNEVGDPTEIFSSDVDRIFVCGYVQTIHPVNIDIYWYYEGELVFRQVGKEMKGHFYNFVEPGNVEIFPKGSYKIDVLVGGLVAKSTEFQIK